MYLLIAFLQVVDIEKDGFADLMNDAGETRADLKVEEPQGNSSGDYKKLYELCEKIKKGEIDFAKWEEGGYVITVRSFVNFPFSLLADRT